jgi:AraC family transcriptional regulator, regulatory protein of adaptative response / methylated-DNA-[protein]-cysteine methyltransferase
MFITNVDKIKQYYKALLAKDQHYIGVFYAGVKTTSIFCIETCRAKKPKFENVEFFSSFKEALDAGYHPCKICNPLKMQMKHHQKYLKLSH